MFKLFKSTKLPIGPQIRAFKCSKSPYDNAFLNATFISSASTIHDYNKLLDDIINSFKGEYLMPNFNSRLYQANQITIYNFFLHKDCYIDYHKQIEEFYSKANIFLTLFTEHEAILDKSFIVEKNLSLTAGVYKNVTEIDKILKILE